MAISNDFTIDYTNLRIYHSSGTTVYTVNELYSWLMDEFDESTTIDDTIPMTAQTPTAYTLTNGWFLDYINNTSHQFLYGGSIKTNGWNATTNTNGIRKKAYDASGAGTPFTGTDIGETITETDSGDTGTILAYDTSLGTDQGYVWIRPDALTNTFADINSAYTVSSSSAAGSFTAASTTGENVWANPFTIGTLVSNTSVYLYQNNSAITSWWSSGHIDVLTLVQEAGSLIDEGTITVYARQYGTLYDHFVTDLSSGNRTPIPLAAFDDINNDTGVVLLNCSSGSGTFTEGELIGNNATQGSATALGIITSVAGTTTDPDLTIYYVGDLTAFTASDTVYSYATSAQADIDTVSDTGPNTGSPATITVTFGATSQDLNNGNGTRPYSVIIDCQQVALTTVYQRLKYLTRRGASSDIDNGSQTVIGEQYEAIGDLYIPYDTASNDPPFSEGETITGPSDFTGTLTAVHDRGTNEGFIVVRNTSGTTPTDGNTLTGGGSGHTVVVDEDTGSDPVTTITPNKQAPFGSFAGGTFFGARGVWLTDYPAANANNFQLIDSEGVQQVPPQTVALTINNTQNGDSVGVFPTTGVGSTTIDKSQFTSATSNNLGDPDFVVQEVIPADTPTQGSIRIPIRVNGKIVDEDRYSYSSWSGSTFILDSVTLTHNYDDNDTAYVPYIDEEATGTSVSTSLTYVTDRYVLTRVRIVGIQPFSVTGTITSGGLTVQTIRTSDSVYQ